jgi:DNA modification methylase
MVLTSPPYDNIRDYEGRPTFDLRALGQELLRVVVDGGIAILVLQDGTKDFAKSLTTFRTAVDWADMGWRLFECCIYERHGRPGAWWSKRFRVDHEYVLIFFKGSRPRHFNKEHLKVPAIHAGLYKGFTARQTSGKLIKQSMVIGASKCRGTIWRYATSGQIEQSNRVKLKHPATMPDKLAADLVQAFSRPGDTVLDPFAGSGTTLIAALNLGRDAIAIEIAPEYVEIIQERVRAETP